MEKELSEAKMQWATIELQRDNLELELHNKQKQFLESQSKIQDLEE